MTAPTTTPAAVIRWESPRPSPYAGCGRTPGSRFDPIAAELRANPGRWGVVYEGSANSGSTVTQIIRSARVAAFAPSGDFEAVLRAQGRGVHAVYARYLGDPEDGAL